MSIIATEEQEQEEELFEGIAVCGTNLSTPVCGGYISLHK